jgi:AraC family transcriptional regulator
MSGEARVTAAGGDAYRERFGRVLAHVEAHLDEDLRLERLGRVAAFSPFHFHRQFSARFGVGVAAYVQLLRLKRAAQQLAYRPQVPVLEVALTAGYEGPEAFARAFKRRLGQSPSAFRKAPDWEAFHATYAPLGAVRSEHMGQQLESAAVRVVDFPETRVAVLEHRGPPERLGESLRRFIAWRKEAGLPPRLSATFNVLHDDPEQVPPEAHRFGLCAATARPVGENPYGVVPGVLPGGRCAVLRHVGSDDTLAATVRFLYAQWLPASGEELRDFPPFLQRVTFFPDVPEHEAVTDVFLPLR